MVITVLKATFTNSKPKVITYRDFKLFNEEKCKTYLKNSLRITVISSYHVFEEIFLKVLGRHASIKNKTIRVNHGPYVTKTMRKSIMKRTELQHGYFKTRSSENVKPFKRQRNFCSGLYKREKKKYFNNLDSNKITDNKLFWITVKPLLSGKGVNTTKIYLVDGGKTVTEDKEVAKTLNQYFSTAVNSLDIFENKSLLTETGNLEDPVAIAIKKIENHLSVLSIKETININDFK